MANWSGRSKGTPLGYWFFIVFIKYLGLGFAYGFLHFVVAYYFLFSWKTSAAIYEFYRKGLGHGRLASVRGIYLNYYALGQMLIDKVAMASGIPSTMPHAVMPATVAGIFSACRSRRPVTGTLR